MKRFLVIILFVFTLAPAFAVNLDKYGHSLTTLWKNYYVYSDEDKPQDQLAILAIICSQAKEKAFVWDYYDACQKTYEVRSRLNYRKQAEYRNQFAQSLLDSEIPVLIFLSSKTSGVAALQVVEENKQKMSSLFCRELWSNMSYSNELKSLILKYASSDYEAAMWDLYLDGVYKEADSLLLKAISLFEQQNQLDRRFDSLYYDNKSTEEDFFLLRENCQDFIKRKNLISGTEKKIADGFTKAEEILVKLSSQKIESYLRRGKIHVIVRNIPNVKVQLRSNNKMVFEKSLVNVKNSFCAKDTIVVDFPPIDDGQYEMRVIAKDETLSTEVGAYSLALAQRCDSEGLSVYVADSKTGEPVKKCTVADCVVDCSDGYCRLSNQNLRELQAAYRDEQGRLRLSDKVYVHRYYDKPVGLQKEELMCNIITDKAAYVLGETVGYKAIVYKSLPTCAPYQGELCNIVLADSEGKEIYKTQLKTNDFGSVYGKLVLPKERRGGLYTLSAFVGDKHLECRSIRVDEFVLPSFELDWNQDNRLWMKGDVVTVNGTVRSYSGHLVSASRAEYRVSSSWWSNDILAKGLLDIDSDGHFQIDIPTDNCQGSFINVSATITDATGETLEFSTSRNLYDELPLCVALLNGEAGTENIIDSDQARFKISFGWDDSSLYYPDAKISYRLYYGEFVADSGFVSNDGGLTLDMRGLRSGSYKLVISAELKSQNGKECKRSEEINLIRSSLKDNALFCNLRTYIREIQTDDYAIQLGATCGPVWYVLELFSNENRLIDHKMVKLDGRYGETGSLQTVSLRRYSSTPSVLVVTTFVDGEIIQYRKRFGSDFGNENLPISITRFTDIARPSSEYHLEFTTRPGSECAVSVFDAASETVMNNEWNPIHHYSLALMKENALSLDGASSSLRSNFSTSLAWEPILYPDQNGKVDMSFRTSDRLSEYVVQLFAHNKKLNSATCRRSFRVSVPVKVSIMEPQYLYEGDVYEAGVSLANSLDSDVSGIVSVRFYDGPSHLDSRLLHTGSSRVTIPANGTASYAFQADVPEGVGTLGILVKFVADDRNSGSDAVFVASKVLPAEQNLKEKYSAVLGSIAKRSEIEAELKSRFVNISPDSARVSTVSIRKMLAAALPSSADPQSDNANSIVDAIRTRSILASMGQSVKYEKSDSLLIDALAACQNQDGGFAWFRGMKSSQYVTAYVLSSIADIPAAASGIDLSAAIGYMDLQKLPLPEYLYVRSLYPSVGSAPKVKEARNFLIPSGKRGNNGDIQSKLFRLSTLRNLMSSVDGQKLASVWGVGDKMKKLSESRRKEIQSLMQYAVNHPYGGVYVPAVSEICSGLLEGNLYAHTLICRIFDEMAGNNPEAKRLADGIRVWMILQKETQQWGADPSYCEALNCIFNGSEDVLSTQVLVMEADYTRAFSGIEPCGNGISIESHYYIGDKELGPESRIRIGDRVRAEYRITSNSNRSFVHVVAPRPAALRPVDQLSGMVSLQGYRDVKSDRSEYWFDVFPEGSIMLSEEFFVVRAGRFGAPVREVECVYSPHYRANDSEILIYLCCGQ